MDKKFLTLQEAAEKYGKSTQTIRRMIKRGDLKAQRIKTPQGFHYVIKRDQIKNADEVLYSSPIQNEVMPQEEAKEGHPTNQNEILTNQTVIEPVPELIIPVVDKSSEILGEMLEQHHGERMALIHILEKLQAELDKERKKPRTLLAQLVDWVLGH